MRRRDFRTWGLELPAGDFACALAARGVLDRASSRVAIDPIDRVARLREIASEGEPLAWELSRPSGIEPAAPPARELADTWRTFVSQRQATRQDLQLEVQWEGPDDPLWLLRELAREEVGAASVYLRADQPVGDASWRWPLRVGTLAGPASDGLRRHLETAATDIDYVHRLTERIELDPGGADAEECDLLLLPQELPQALAAVLSLPRPPVPDAVVVLGGAAGSATAAQLGALRASMRCSGVALAPVPEAEVPEWFHQLMRELAHDRSLDRALFVAARKIGAPLPVLFFARRLVRFSRVSERVYEMAVRLDRPAMRDRRLDIPLDSYLGRELGMTGNRSAGEVARAMRELPSSAYEHEEDMASAAAELERMVEKAARRRPATRASRPSGKGLGETLWRSPSPGRPIEGLPEESSTGSDTQARKRYPRTGLGEEAREEAGEGAPEKKPRYLQGRVLDAAAAEPRLPLEAFLDGRLHEIQVSVGRQKAGWLVPVSGQVFPDHELPKNRTEHELTVVFSEPGLLPEPQVAKIVLPREGDSSVCGFPLHVPEGTERVSGRVVVLYKNRVLQTGLLTGRVAADRASGEAFAAEDRIRLDIEAVVRPDLGDLEARRSFDAALVLNHDAAGVPGVLKLADDHATVEVLPEVDRLIRWFDDKLSKVAFDREEFEGSLETPATVELLRELARYGAELYESLVTDQWGADKPLVKAERLQVLSAHPEARFPIEMLYGRPAPAPDAGLCEHAAEALRTGKCPDSCSQEDPRSCICPLAFWGLSRVIERHAHDPKLAREVKKELADHVLQAEPIEGRRTLEIVGPSLVAATQKVEKIVSDDWKKLRQEVAKALKAPAHTAASWPAWVQAVKKEKARLHLLLVHTERVAAGDPMQQMEIGQGSWLAVVDLDESHVRFPVENPAPFVILLGCETGAPELSFMGFPAKLRRKGAAVVVCAQSTIHAVHAVPVAQGLVTTLRRLVEDGETTFGEVMRAARRELLAVGLPMVLCLTAFGDADWRLVAAEPEA